jgi:hypothetical protein
MSTPDELLMAELQAVMTEAGTTIFDERTAEAKSIITMLDDQFTKDGYFGSYLFALTKTTEEEYQQMLNGDAQVVGGKPEDLTSGDYTGGKITKLYTFDTHEELAQIVSEPQSMLMTYHIKKQSGLIIRTNLPDGRRLTACAAPGFVVVKSGDNVSILTLDSDDPDPKLAFADYDTETIELFHSLWQGNLYPRTMERDYPETYKEVIGKLKRESGIDDEEEGE